jgi:hypothetical protein
MVSVGRGTWNAVGPPVLQLARGVHRGIWEGFDGRISGRWGITGITQAAIMRRAVESEAAQLSCTAEDPRNPQEPGLLNSSRPPFLSARGNQSPGAVCTGDGRARLRHGAMREGWFWDCA